MRKTPGNSDVDNASRDCFRERAFCLRPLKQSHDALSTSLLPGLLRNSEVANNGMGFPGSLTWCNSSLRIGEKLHHLLMVYAFYFLATIFLLPLDKTREIMAKLESLKQLEGKPKYGFVAAFFDRIYVNSCIKFPFKWFFSTYNTFSNMMLGMKITRTAFKRLFLVTIKPDGEDTAGYEAFNDELKKRSSQKPFYSDAYQGCLRIFGGKCFMNKTSFKVTKSRFCACKFTSYIRRPYSAYNGNNPILSYPLLSYSIIISYPSLSCRILSYPILSYPILSYSIISCFSPLFCSSYQYIAIHFCHDTNKYSLSFYFKTFFSFIFVCTIV